MYHKSPAYLYFKAEQYALTVVKQNYSKRRRHICCYQKHISVTKASKCEQVGILKNNNSKCKWYSILLTAEVRTMPLKHDTLTAAAETKD